VPALWLFLKFMNNFYENNIEEILSSWGAKQHLIPANDQVLKAQTLAHHPLAPLEANSFLPHRIPWFALGLAGLAVVMFFVNTIHINPGFYQKAFPTTSNSISELGIPSSDKQYFPSSPISDGREFLKKDYNATIRSREVETLTTRIQTMIRGFNGRVDGSSSSEKFGYISFVIPASSLDAFRSEIKSLVPNKFYIEQTSAQNLLPQKQSIEHVLIETEASISQLQISRQQAVDAHKKALASLSTQISSVSKQIAALDAEVSYDPARQAEIAAQKQQLTNRKISLQNQIATENKNYEQNLSSIDAQIRDSQTTLDSLRNQDQSLLDNVATVQGTISVNWIGIGELMDLYLPGPLIAWVLLAAAVAAYVWQRRQLRMPLI